MCHTDRASLGRWLGSLGRLVSISGRLPRDRPSGLEASRGHRRLMYALGRVRLVHKIHLNHLPRQHVAVLHGDPATHLLLLHLLLRQSLL